jgi:hypothetical protein
MTMQPWNPDVIKHRCPLHEPRAVICAPIEGGAMPGKTPQRPSTKKAGKSLKEKREAKKSKKADRKISGG